MAAPSSLVNKKSPIKNGLLILLFVLLGLIVLKAFQSNQREKSRSRSIALVESYRAEMFMRMADALKSVPQPPSIFQSNAHEKISDSSNSLITQAKSVIDKATADQPDDVVLLSKKIILKVYL